MGKFGELLQEARKRKGLTLRKLAQFTKMQPSLLSEIENGRRMPPKEDKVEEIADDLAFILGVNREELIEAARLDRNMRKPVFLDRLDQNLAWSLCRAAENVSEDKLNDAFKDILDKLK